jgi:hypothetical protein
MGGRYPGKYPPKMRVIAVINMFILGFIAAIVLSEADLKISQLKPIAVIGVWFVVAFFVVGTIMNRLRSESATHYKD